MNNSLNRLRPWYIATGLCMALVIFILVWAGVTKIDIAIKGDGNIVAYGNNRKAQHLEGGVVTRLLVREGDKVMHGQIIASIAPDIASSEIGEKRAKIDSLRVSTLRLKAESGQTRLILPPTADEHTRLLYDHEMNLFETNQKLISSKVAALLQSSERSDAEAKSKEAQLIGLKIQESAIMKSINMQTTALKGGAGLPGRLAEIESQIAGIRATIYSIPDAIIADHKAAEEARLRAESEKLMAMQEAAAKLVLTQTEMESLMESIKASEDRLRRVDVISPIDGIVQKLNVFAVGEILPPNSTVAEIVPSGEGLIIDAHIKPDQVRGIKPGLPALVRISAYDVSRFGSLTGHVVGISPDSTKDEKTGLSFYRVRIKTDKSEISGEPLIIGMQTDISIITGRRSILNYFTSPIVGWTQTTMREK